MAVATGRSRSSRSSLGRNLPQPLLGKEGSRRATGGWHCRAAHPRWMRGRVHAARDGAVPQRTGPCRKGRGHAAEDGAMLQRAGLCNVSSWW